MKNITSGLCSKRWLLNLSIGSIATLVVPISTFVSITINGKTVQVNKWLESGNLTVNVPF